MKLIIAEKPSLARNIVAGIGQNSVRRDGYLECGDYLISWAFGHLFSLADVEAYSDNPRGDERARWTMDNLPVSRRSFGMSSAAMPTSSPIRVLKSNTA